MIWLILGTMLLAAAIVVAWPLIHHEKRLSLQSIFAVVVVLALSAGLYAAIGTPQEESAGSELASIEEMVAGLDQRLRDNPDDLAGWKMLGRTYFQLRVYDKRSDLDAGSDHINGPCRRTVRKRYCYFTQ
jgi:cytochrome c-type biogenesis protein CcmH